MRHLFYLYVLCTSMLLPFASDVIAKPKLQGTYKFWRVFTEGEGVMQHCFAVSEPHKKHPSHVRRGDVFFSVSSRPAQNIFQEIGLRIGYKFSEQSQPYVSIDGQDYDFFSGITAQAAEIAAYWAWPKYAQDQASLIEALRRGNQLIVKGTSKRGTLTTDTYSLLGFTAAMEKLDLLCPKP